MRQLQNNNTMLWRTNQNITYEICLQLHSQSSEIIITEYKINRLIFSALCRPKSSLLLESPQAPEDDSRQR